MDKSYYQTPSPLAIDILKLFDVPLNESCIEAIEWGENKHGWRFSEASCFKYLWRLGTKTRNIESDCKKILDYVSRAIDNGSPITETLRKVQTEVIKLQLANDVVISLRFEDEDDNYDDYVLA